MRTNLASIRDELAGEHHEITTLADALGAAEPAGAAPLLDRLHELLRRHFAHEEHPGGFYDALGACAPGSRDDLRVLVDQHFQIVSRLQALRERARRAGGAELSGELAALGELLREHERHEMEMVNRLTSR